MVGREDLLSAIALNSTMFNGARVAGPAIAGILVAWIGEGWCFLANAVSYLAVIAGLLMMHINKKDTENEHAGSLIENMKEGIRFARHTPDSRPAYSFGDGEFADTALHRAHANFRGPHHAWRGLDVWSNDGCNLEWAQMIGALAIAMRPGNCARHWKHCGVRGDRLWRCC